MQEYLACFIYYTVVVLIPLKQTYLAFKTNANQQTFSLWANYWAIFCFVGYFKGLLGFLTYQPFTFLFMLFLLWCYHSDYKGALFISQSIRNLIKSNTNATKILNELNQHLKIFNVFENDPAIQQSKIKGQ